MKSSPYVVLVVEDQFLARVSIAIDLEDAGFVVHKAADTHHALEMLERYPQIEVLFTDINMPGALNGLDLATRVRLRWPKIGIVITSGHQTPLTSQMPPDAIFLSKPYNARDATRMLLDMVSDQRSGAELACPTRRLGEERQGRHVRSHLPARQ